MGSVPTTCQWSITLPPPDGTISGIHHQGKLWLLALCLVLIHEVGGGERRAVDVDHHWVALVQDEHLKANFT